MNLKAVALMSLCSLGMVSGQFATAIGAAIVAKAIWVKGIALAAVASGVGAGVGSGSLLGGRPTSGGHGKRSAEDGQLEEAAFAMLANQEKNESQECFRRLICTLATGNMKQTQFDIIPKFLASKDVSVESPEFDYALAAKIGRKERSIESCESRYSCPLSSQEILNFF